jgi:hypothetical protein
MNLLKKQNWWICVLLNIVTLGLFTFFVAGKLDVYEDDAWYNHWYYWVLGFLCFIIPGLIMFVIFSIESACLVCAKLNVPGQEIYNLPYSWILCLIIPILGWTLFIIMFVYVHICYAFYLN